MIKGIRLTHRVLMASGFQIISSRIGEDAIVSWYEKDGFKTTTSPVKELIYKGTVYKVEYLHELQHLFFDLKGEELTVNFSTP